MNTLSILSFGGIITLAVLLVAFELKDRQGGSGSRGNGNGYVYYTHNNVAVRICHSFSSRYKIYVNGGCPVETKQDRYGRYFILKARSASDAEYQIDELYRRR